MEVIMQKRKIVHIIVAAHIGGAAIDMVRAHLSGAGM